jgi:hypothetical protein
MLSHRLQQHFAALGARLLVRTDPKSTLVRLALGQDARGERFELTLPRLSRHLVTVLAVQPRRQRLILKLGSGRGRKYVLVQSGETRSVRTLRTAEARAVLQAAPRSDSLPTAA